MKKMLIAPIELTENDRAILESYKVMMDGLSDYLGSAYELVLHSLDNLEHSAIKVINGYHTGRTEGAPITEMALRMLEHIAATKQKDYVCYHGYNKDGHPLRSTTIAIRSSGRIIGLLCMNFYMDTPLSDLFKTFSAAPFIDETYVQSAEDTIHAAIERAKAVVDETMPENAPARNRAIIEQLDASGVFRIKDAVNCVAQALNISRNTVYLHLRTLREKGKK
ncbi:MAG: PAS domain-containing protein [Clostridia bacterium]|nr:PAS domain-containing protein [Clostridia bacterium]